MMETINSVGLSSHEREIIVSALHMRICWIETRTSTLRAMDVAAGHDGKIYPLDQGQMRLIIKIEDLIEKLRLPQPCVRIGPP